MKNRKQENIKGDKKVGDGNEGLGKDWKVGNKVGMEGKGEARRKQSN